MSYIEKWLQKTLPGDKLIIVGAGSLGKLTVDCVLRNKEIPINNIAILDDDINKHGNMVLGVPVIGSISNMNNLKKRDLNLSFVIAIANNNVRRQVANKHSDIKYISVISKESNISPFSKIGEGCIILPGVVIDPDAQIKDHVIVNKTATIAHDVVLHEFSQVSPGVNFGGYVELGVCSFVGLGASVLPTINITNEVVIGAGAVVTKDINVSSSVYVGNPAKLLKRV